MGWAELFARGRERYARSRRISRRNRALMIGGFLAVVGWNMYSDTAHQLNGKPSTATLIEHIKECTIEYQRVGESRRKDPMACDSADALQRRFGSAKIRISQDTFARIRFPLADGRVHEAKVNESKLDSYSLPIGTQIAVVYAPDQPSDVRAVLTWERFRVSFMIFAVGLVFLMVVFARQIGALVAWAFANRTSSADNEPREPRPTVVVVSNRGALPTMGSEPRASFGRRK